MAGKSKPQLIADSTFLEEIKAYIASCNTFVEGRNLRAYQSTIYQTGTFPRSGPLEDQHFRVAGTLCLTPKSYAWMFRSTQSQGDVWLLSGDCAQGYAIRAAFVPGKDLYVLDGEPDAQSISQRAHVSEFYSGRWDAIPTEQKTDLPPTVLCVGHENYAHFMWNELGALLLCEPLTPCASLEIEVAQEPIAPLDSLWLSAAGRAFRRAAVFSAGYREQQLVFSVGGFAVTALAKERIRSACESIADREPRTYRPSGRFVLWVSLKVDVRQAINLNDALLALFQKLDSLSLPCDVLLDGFSPPSDLDFEGRYPITLLVGHQQRVGEFASELVDRAARLAFQSVAIYDLTTLSTPAAMAAARHAHYYVCHNGTQQHKIAWLYNVPGLIHGNPYTLRNLSTWWTAEMALSSIIPKLAPLECIASAPPAPHRPVDVMLEPYVISNIDMFVDSIIPEVITAVEARQTAS